MISWEHLTKFPKWVPLALGVFGVLLLGVLDYLTGPELAFSLFYLLPIFLVTWMVGRTAGVSIAVLGAVTWLVADLAWDVPNSSVIVHYWNGAVRLGFFLIVVRLLSAWKQNKEEKEKALKNILSALSGENAVRKRLSRQSRSQMSSCDSLRRTSRRRVRRSALQ